MGEEKVTIMVLKVDLQCEKCYKKVKKVLCKFPQIRDQTYDEKNNQVIIKVVCCSPEKIRDKICCKGSCAIKRIDILPKPEPKKKEPELKKDKPEPEKKPEPKKEPEPKKKPEETKSIAPPFPTYPPVTVNVCCIVCHGWHPYIEYDGYYGRPVYDSYCGGRSYSTSSYCVTRPDCFSEENPQACAIM